MNRHYFKSQTRWTRVPAAIEAHRCDTVVGVAIHPERAVTDPPQEPARIFMTPHEAQAFASWLSQQADQLLAKQQRAAARRAARLAAKLQREEGL